jgi:hypothetical protein
VQISQGRSKNKNRGEELKVKERMEKDDARKIIKTSKVLKTDS